MMKTCQSCNYPNPDSRTECFKCSNALSQFTDEKNEQIQAQLQANSSAASQKARAEQVYARLQLQHSPGRDKYWALSAIVTFVESIAVLAMIILVAIFLIDVALSLEKGSFDGEWMRQMGYFGCAVSAFVTAQLYRLLMDIERNTRKKS